MIHFKTVQWKNFLSTGNSFTKIQLDAHATTLIVGQNGSGKSTLLDAICFALFGKPYRNVNKPQLMNSINNKNCLVEIEFTIGARHYKIARGIKPSIFEIWINGEMLDQDAASKDYQKYLEEHILKLNYKSFTQIVILGSASFTPFMQLPAASRREVIEDILDIKIFSAMNLVLKDKAAELKTKLQAVDGKITIAKTKAQVQKDYIQTLLDDRDAKVAEIDNKIQESNSEIDERSKLYSNLRTKKIEFITTIEDADDVTSNIQQILEKIQEFEITASKIQKEISFFHNNDNCPKCKQGIPHEFKHIIVKENEEELNSVETNKEEIASIHRSLKARLKEISIINEKIIDITSQMNEVKNDISTAERYIRRLELEKADVSKKVGNIDAERDKLKLLAKETVEILKERSDLCETNTYYDVANILLKDSGIKTRIIKQYMPVINKLVNKFLTTMDFFVQFTLNEKFEEVIKSRHRDEFSYESFSEGEKQRIDLSLVFTWRTIAKLKNSASTNLLILDEIFDSSLDSSATEHVMSLLNTLGEGTNVFVISHKGDQLFDKFAHIIKFNKKQNFSVIAS